MKRPPVSVFLGPFGVPVVWTDGTETITTQGILDAPDRTMDLGYPISATDYSLTFGTNDLKSLVKNQNLTVDGEQYTVRDVSSLWDGTFSRATLRKI